MAESIRKRLHAETKDIGRGDRIVRFVISTMDVDREGDVMIPQGCNTADFDKSPTVFWNHDYDRPIAKSVKFTREADRLLSDTEFPRRPEGHVGEWFPDTVLALIREGVINGVSIGFTPSASGMRKATPTDVKQFGDGCKRVFTMWNLLEYSVAPLPANQNALQLAYTKGAISAAACKSLFDVDVVTEAASVASEVVADVVDAVDEVAASVDTKRRTHMLIVVKRQPAPARPKRRKPNMRKILDDATRMEQARRKGLLWV